MNNSPDQTNIVTYSARNRNSIYDIGYTYNLRKLIIFISTPGTRSYFPGNPHEDRWCDHNGNFHFIPPLAFRLFILSLIISVLFSYKISQGSVIFI